VQSRDRYSYFCLTAAVGQKRTCRPMGRGSSGSSQQKQKEGHLMFGVVHFLSGHAEVFHETVSMTLSIHHFPFYLAINGQKTPTVLGNGN